MRRSLFLIYGCISLLLGAAQSSPGLDGFKLNPGCKLPFGDIAPGVDQAASCGNSGKIKTGPKSFESRAKNNFCADTSVKTAVDFNILRQMQALPIDKNNLGDRHVLHAIFKLGNGQSIGEGSVVRLKAFVKEAHISDCESGEDVNCKETGFDVNDIHIALVDPTVPNARSQDECTSVTAEMTPHFRPQAWSQIDLKTPVNNAIRVTRQLFFDDSHEPCVKKADGTFTVNPHDPRRSSLWEIHPVYQLEVCTNSDPDQCDVNSESKAMWVPFNEWLNRPGIATEATGQMPRQECQKLGPKRGRRPKPAH